MVMRLSDMRGGIRPFTRDEVYRGNEHCDKIPYPFEDRSYLIVVHETYFAILEEISPDRYVYRWYWQEED